MPSPFYLILSPYFVYLKSRGTMSDALSRVSEWLDKSCAPSIREPLCVVDNCQSTKREQVSKSQKRKRASDVISTMSRTPSPKKRALAVGLGESPLAQGELFPLALARYVIDSCSPQTSKRNSHRDIKFLSWKPSHNLLPNLPVPRLPVEAQRNGN